MVKLLWWYMCQLETVFFMRGHDVCVMCWVGWNSVLLAAYSVFANKKFITSGYVRKISPHIPWPLHNKQEGLSVEGQLPACQQV